MEYWFYDEKATKEQINRCLNSCLYSAVAETEEKIKHYTNPKIIISLEDKTLFETMELLSSLPRNNHYIINYIDNKIDYEIIKQFIKNKSSFPNVEFCCFLKIKQNDKSTQEKINDCLHSRQQVLNVISYGVDYVLLHQDNDNTNALEFIKKFRDKGIYKTKIIVPHPLHEAIMFENKDVIYDGVFWIEKDILYGDNYK